MPRHHDARQARSSLPALIHGAWDRT
jgi:hypothetical protein